MKMTEFGHRGVGVGGGRGWVVLGGVGLHPLDPPLTKIKIILYHVFIVKKSEISTFCHRF